VQQGQYRGTWVCQGSGRGKNTGLFQARSSSSSSSSSCTSLLFLSCADLLILIDFPYIFTMLSTFMACTQMHSWTGANTPLVMHWALQGNGGAHSARHTSWQATNKTVQRAHRRSGVFVCVIVLRGALSSTTTHIICILLPPELNKAIALVSVGNTILWHVHVDCGISIGQQEMGGASAYGSEGARGGAATASAHRRTHPRVHPG
jgi:hypothetical protein